MSKVVTHFVLCVIKKYVDIFKIFHDSGLNEAIP